MFRRLVLIVTTLLTVLFVGLWIERSLRTVSLDKLKLQVETARKAFNEIDDELYHAIRAESDANDKPQLQRGIAEINADLSRARAAADAAEITILDASAEHEATGKRYFTYPAAWDLSHYRDHWLFIHVSVDAVTVSYNSTDAIPLRANWRPEKQSHVFMAGQMDSMLQRYVIESNAPIPYRQAVAWRANSRPMSADRLLELLRGEGFFFNYNAEPTREMILQVPLWMLILLFGVFPTYALIARRVREHIRIERGQCLKCGYNLTGNTSGVCPECGTKVLARSRGFEFV
jgi:hypothetical protein